MFLRAARLKENDIGGGIVRTAFRMGARYLIANTKLTAQEVMSINPANRMSLIDKGYLAVWPKIDAAPAAKGERFTVHTGGGRYDVIEGRRLNEDSLSKEEAHALSEGQIH